jgi:four helix bundle protein
MRAFSDLRVWQRSHQFVLLIYRMSESVPWYDGLRSQIRRAAAAIPTNLAEGAKMESEKEFARYIQISEGSLAEVQYLLMLLRDLGHITEAQYAEAHAEAAGIARQLHALKQAVRKRAAAA